MTAFKRAFTVTTRSGHAKLPLRAPEDGRGRIDDQAGRTHIQAYAIPFMTGASSVTSSTTDAKKPSLDQFLMPGLEALFEKALKAGYPRDEILAVMIDLLDDTTLGGLANP